MKHVLKGAFAVALAASLLPLGSNTGFAQGRDRGGDGPGTGAAPPAARSAPPRASAPARQERPAARAPERREPSSAQRAPERRAVERSRVRERAVVRERAAEGRDRSRAQSRTQAREKQAEQRRVRQSQERRQQAGERRNQSTPKAEAGRRQDPAVRATERQGRDRAQPVSRVQVTDQQRREVRERLFRDGRGDRISRRDINVRLAVGNHIPRHHRRHVHRFTPALLALAPLYAAYSYIIVDDTICVVDPETYVIVDVIPSSIEQAGTRQPVLALSAGQRQCLYEHTPRDVVQADVRVRLALGAEIPGRVELLAFPDEALGCAGELAAFRYIVLENGDLVIVDPVDRSVAMVIQD